MRAASNVTPSVFSLSNNIVMGQPATVIVVVLSCTKQTNFRFVWVKWKIVLPEPMLKAGSARPEASEVASGWFDEGSVKLCEIAIFVIVDAVTINKPADWCYICREQDRSKNGPLWDTRAGLSYRRR